MKYYYETQLQAVTTADGNVLHYQYVLMISNGHGSWTSQPVVTDATTAEEAEHRAGEDVKKLVRVLEGVDAEVKFLGQDTGRDQDQDPS